MKSKNFKKIQKRAKLIRAITWIVLLIVLVAHMFALAFAVMAADFPFMEPAHATSEPAEPFDPAKSTVYYGNDVLQEEPKQLEVAMVKADAHIEPSEPICEAPEAPVPTETEPQYTLGDLETLAQVICYEAGGEDTEIQILVGCVIRNRVESDLFPDTFYEVVTQPSQYGKLSEWGPFWPKWADAGIKNHCRKIAQIVLLGEADCPRNVVYQASFKQGSGVYKHYDGYYFCYE